MTATMDLEFRRLVVEVIERLDYEVMIEPMRKTEHRTWRARIVSWLTEPTYSLPVPDMLVARGDRKVVVEAKGYPVLPGPVIQAGHYADYFECPAVICVPDDAFPGIPDSVREFAEINGIFLTPVGEIGDTLRRLL